MTIKVRKFRSTNGTRWFYEGECPQCPYVSLTEVSHADAVRRTENHVTWWHDALGH